MSLKETIHQWVESFPEDSPGLRELYEEARLDMALDEAEEDIKAGRVFTIEEVRERRAARCRERRSA